MSSKFVLQQEDGTVEGGNARGQYAVDLQMSRNDRIHVASGYGSVIAGGQFNIASSTASFIGGGYLNSNNGGYATITGGHSNIVTGSFQAIVGGISNSITSPFSTSSFIGGGENNSITAGAGQTNCVISGGAGNVASRGYATISGGQSNTASTNTHATVVGGQSNTSSGTHSISGGLSSTASGQRAIAFGAATASGQFSLAIGDAVSSSGAKSIALGADSQATQSSSVAIGNAVFAQAENSFASGNRSFAYLLGQNSRANGRFVANGDAQQSYLTARKSDTLNSAGTTVLSLDGTGTTNLIIPNANNRAWNVTVKWVAVCTATGSGTTAVGDVAIATDSFMFKKVGGTSSIGILTNLQNSQDATMAGATCSYAVGGSQDLQITFTAPASANATTFRVVAKVELTEVAW